MSLIGAIQTFLFKGEYIGDIDMKILHFAQRVWVNICTVYALATSKGLTHLTGNVRCFYSKNSAQ